MITELFKSLVKQTTPNGFEYLLYDCIPNARKDEYGNRFVIVGDGPHTHLFTCHLDTYPLTQKSEEITIIEDGDIIRTYGRTLLGADDKAGVTVLLAMIKGGVNGIYGFFLAEEIGLLGSHYAANDTKWKELMKDVKAVISFDRRGTSSIITHQGGKKTCSQKYAKLIQKGFAKQEILLELDDTGSATDSLSFHKCNRSLQCTNISVGYYNAHSVLEYQDIAYLERLCSAAVHVDWPIP